MQEWRVGRRYVKREEGVSAREAELMRQLEEEKARTAAVVAEFEAYMREHQVLRMQQKEQRCRV